MGTGSDSVAIAGTIDFVTSGRADEIALSQAVDGVQVKTTKMTIPHQGTPSPTPTPVAIPLNMSPGVTEALVLHLECAEQLFLDITTNNATHPGPVRIAIKGDTFLTLAPTNPLSGSFVPSGAIIAISALNFSTTDDVELAVTLAAQAQTSDPISTFWPPVQ